MSKVWLLRSGLPVLLKFMAVRRWCSPQGTDADVRSYKTSQREEGLVIETVRLSFIFRDMYQFCD